VKALLIAIGNPWRRDDGAAPRVLELLGPLDGVDARTEIQPTPEMAADMEGVDIVVFVDADLTPGEARIEPLDPGPPSSGTIGHSLRPCEVLLLARALFGFAGECYLCRIPGYDFGEGEGLTAETEKQSGRAAELLRELLSAKAGK
jgi:hydrogenase maturation protease